MKLKDLVGKMAIRTQKARGFAPWETDRAIRLDFMVPVPIFDDRERYMDEPVKIVAVEESRLLLKEMARESCWKESMLMNTGRIMRGFCIRKRKRRKRLKS